jgi:tricorn protease-like protein
MVAQSRFALRQWAIWAIKGSQLMVSALTFFALVVGWLLPLSTQARERSIAFASKAQAEKSMNIPLAARAKRVAPPSVQAITIDGMRYEAVLWGRERGLDQNGGLIEIFNTSHAQSVGIIRVYAIEYLPQIETDVQDVFIESMSVSADRKHLLVTDEKGRRYLVDLEQLTSQPAP